MLGDWGRGLGVGSGWGLGIGRLSRGYGVGFIFTSLQQLDNTNEKELWYRIFNRVPSQKLSLVSMDSVLRSVAATLRHHVVDPRDQASLTTMYENLQKTRKFWEQTNWDKCCTYMGKTVIHTKDAEMFHAAIQLATKIDMI